MIKKAGLELTNTYNKLPSGLKSFLIKAVLLFVGWRLAYYFVLEPRDIPDKQLIDWVIDGTFQTLTFVYDQLAIQGDTIWVNGQPTLTVAKACNGLELIVLYLGFLFCLPTNAKRLVAFAVVGPLIIYGLNVLRCSALAVMFYNNHYLADFAHHYVFKLVIYAVVFGLWIWYSKKYVSYGK
ncbi:MAG: hypothetical protein EOP56_12520 [Sphingobacteriales bacterium]|nr:MAG: hypothetical protein EOP56_12520 [Sphingobacteriales bacterium]